MGVEPMRVLIADDEPLARERLASYPGSKSWRKQAMGTPPCTPAPSTIPT